MLDLQTWQDVLRLQTLADERELTVERVQKREDSSSEKVANFFMWTHDSSVFFFCFQCFQPEK